jgi:hypothetical protein
VEIVVPSNLADLAEDLVGLVGELEFTVFLKGAWNRERLVVEDWLVPRQACSPCTVEVLEDPPLEFNGALHRHPPGVRGFSATDRAYFNANLVFSIVFISPREFPTAEVYLPLGEAARLAVPARAVEGPLLSEARRALARLQPAGTTLLGDESPPGRFPAASVSVARMTLLPPFRREYSV